MKSSMAGVKNIGGLLKATFNDWIEDKALRLSAAISYYSIFSIAPLLIIAIGVAGMALGPEAVQGKLQPQLAQYVGPHAAEGVQTMVQSAAKPSHGVIATVLGFLTLILGATGVFGQLKDALNTIWEVQTKSGSGIMAFIKERVLSFGMVLVIGFLLLTSLLLSTVMSAFSAQLETILPIPKFIFAIGAFLISFGVVTTLFAFIFKVLPDATVEWRDVWVGAAVTALLFELGKVGLGFYLGKQGAESAYGAATSIVLLLLWVYYASCILFFGAEFTQVYAKSRGRVVQPALNAERITTEARAQQGLAKGEKECPVSPMPEPARERIPAPAFPQPALVRLPDPEANQPSPLGALLAVTGASMVLGLLSRGWVEKSKRPSRKFKEGVVGLTRQAGQAFATALDKTTTKVKERVS